MTISQQAASLWPQGKRGCMALAFDLDGPTGDAMLNGTLWQKADYFTFGAYGPYRALERILDLLDDHQLPATFLFRRGWWKTGRNSVRRLSDAGMKWRITAIVMSLLRHQRGETVMGDAKIP